MDLGLKGRAALVLAASRGLGKASALCLSQEGAMVAVASRSEEAAAAAARSIGQISGNRTLGLKVDVTRPEDIRQAVAHTVGEFGRLDTLVINAGGPPSGLFTELDDAAWQQAFELNLLSAVRSIREALPHLRKSDAPRVVAITSTSVRQPISGLLLSNSVRAGVLGLIKTLSFELGPDGILLNCVAPGRIATDRIAELDEGTAQRTGRTRQEVRHEHERSIPLGRYGDPAEFGRAVCFLGSPANSYITGTTVYVDGGSTRSVI
ncbi:MAG: SDR family oxidoreductase [Bacillota bacterium]